MLKSFHLYNDSLDALPEKPLLITTLNAHSYNVACKDPVFEQALKGSDVLIPDGISVVWAMRILRRTKSQEPGTKTLKKIAGEDLFYWEMCRLDTHSRASVIVETHGRASMIVETQGRASVIDDTQSRASMINETHGRASVIDDTQSRASMIDDTQSRASMINETHGRASNVIKLGI
jgi:hypothetical protein